MYRKGVAGGGWADDSDDDIQEKVENEARTDVASLAGDAQSRVDQASDCTESIEHDILLNFVQNSLENYTSLNRDLKTFYVSK